MVSNNLLSKSACTLLAMLVSTPSLFAKDLPGFRLNHREDPTPGCHWVVKKGAKKIRAVSSPTTGSHDKKISLTDGDAFKILGIVWEFKPYEATTQDAGTCTVRLLGKNRRKIDFRELQSLPVKQISFRQKTPIVMIGSTELLKEGILISAGNDTYLLEKCVDVAVPPGDPVVGSGVIPNHTSWYRTWYEVQHKSKKFWLESPGLEDFAKKTCP